MHLTNHHRSGFVAIAAMLLGLLAWPATAQSPTASMVTGQGVAVQATVFGILGTPTTTALADTGVIGQPALATAGKGAHSSTTYPKWPTIGMLVSTAGPNKEEL